MTDMTLKARLEKIEYWRNGNGTKGAAQQIEDHEERITCIETHHAKEELMIIRAVKKAMHERSKSMSGILRALGPYVAAISAIVVAIISATKQGG